MKPKIQQVINDWEQASGGWELMNKEEVRGPKTLHRVLLKNQRWLRDHHSEVERRAERVIEKAKLPDLWPI